MQRSWTPRAVGVAVLSVLGAVACSGSALGDGEVDGTQGASMQPDTETGLAQMPEASGVTSQSDGSTEGISGGVSNPPDTSEPHEDDQHLPACVSNQAGARIGVSLAVECVPGDYSGRFEVTGALANGFQLESVDTVPEPLCDDSHVRAFVGGTGAPPLVVGQEYDVEYEFGERCVMGIGRAALAIRDLDGQLLLASFDKCVGLLESVPFLESLGLTVAAEDSCAWPSSTCEPKLTGYALRVRRVEREALLSPGEEFRFESSEGSSASCSLAAPGRKDPPPASASTTSPATSSRSRLSQQQCRSLRRGRGAACRQRPGVASKRCARNDSWRPVPCSGVIALDLEGLRHEVFGELGSEQTMRTEPTGRTFPQKRRSA